MELGVDSIFYKFSDEFPLKVWYIPELECSTMMVSQFDQNTIRRARLNRADKRHLMAALLPASVMGSHTLENNVQEIYDLVRKLSYPITEKEYDRIAEKLFGSTDRADALKMACEQIYDVVSLLKFCFV